MNIPNAIDRIKLLAPLDADGVGGEWWLHHKIDGRYKYTHDHMGDATGHLDKLQDEFWKLRDTAIALGVDAETARNERDELAALLLAARDNCTSVAVIAKLDAALARLEGTEK